MRILLLIGLLACGGKSSDSTIPTGIAPGTSGGLPSGTASGTPVTGTPSGTTGGTPTGTPTGTTSAIQATPDAWCPAEDRVALVEITDFGAPVLTAWVYDRTDPWIAAPALQDTHCRHHVYAPGTCPAPCATDEVCGLNDTCVPRQLPALDAVVTVHSSSGDEVFAADPVSGALGGNLTATGTLDIELSWAGTTVLASGMQLPTALSNPTMITYGPWDAPGDLTLGWDATDQRVWTSIQINHHVAGPTFTECHPQGSDGSLVIDAAMIDPLAVVTGLEFQTLDHAAFAMAQTPLGCVDFRLRRPGFPTAP